MCACELVCSHLCQCSEYKGFEVVDMRGFRRFQPDRENENDVGLVEPGSGAGARSRRPDARALDRSGSRERASGTLFDRRENLAGQVGTVNVETIIQSLCVPKTLSGFIRIIESAKLAR